MLSVEVASNDSYVLKAFDLEEVDEPRLVIADMRGDTMRKYILDGILGDARTITGFINDFFAGKLKVSEEGDENFGRYADYLGSGGDWDTRSELENGIETADGACWRQLVSHNHLLSRMKTNTYVPWTAPPQVGGAGGPGHGRTRQGDQGEELQEGGARLDERCPSRVLCTLVVRLHGYGVQCPQK